MQLPDSFIKRMRSLLGEEYDAFEAALQQDPSVSIRYNKHKTTHIPAFKPVPWSKRGYYLAERPAFTFDPLFHAGLYYVQEASSMFVEAVIDQYVQDEPVCFLDLCAAPGGKTTAAIDALPEGSLIVANEIDRKRCHILAENVTKWGSPFSMVTNNRSEHFSELTNFFDVILTDVPCSGEGMFRKDPQAIEEWSEANVQNCVERQKEIIQNIWPSLKPGGILIYSTCTYNVQENEEMISFIADNMDATILPLHSESEWGIHAPLMGNEAVCRFMPHTTKGEGLFMAALRKNSSDSSFSEFRANSSMKKDSKKTHKQSASKTVFPEEVKNWVLSKDNFVFEIQNEQLLAFPRSHFEAMKKISSVLNPLLRGLVLGSLKGKDVIPDHALALSTQINRDKMQSVEVDKQTALNYLRREAIVLDSDVPKGFVLLTYQNQPIGWVKNIGNRSNNLYPTEWRIRSGYTPENEWDALA